MSLRGRSVSEKKTASKGVGAKPPPKAGIAMGPATKAGAKRTAKTAPAKGAGQAHSDLRAFAANLIRLRAEAGLTQDQLAARSGVSQSHISGLEKGTWEPRLSTVLALARAFGVAPAALVRGWDVA